LNAASGCGQSGGACIHIHDLMGTPSAQVQQVALATH
jgi:hypothetical protein